MNLVVESTEVPKLHTSKDVNKGDQYKPLVVSSRNTQTLIT